MQSLSDLIKERFEETHNQRLVTKVISKEEKDWKDNKKYVDDLPNNYMNLLKGKIKNEPLSVKKTKIMGGNAIDITIKTQQRKGFFRLAYETELHILEKSPEKEVNRVWYIAWNNTKNTCYIRDLLNPQL